MNPYTKKYLDFDQTDENVKFTDICKMSKFPYEIYALEEQMKSLSKWITKDKLENQEYNNTNFQVVQDLYNEKIKRKEMKKPFYFITLNPKPDVDFNEFKSAVDDITTWSWVELMTYAFEQRGTTIETAGNGFHAHIIIEKYNIEFGKMRTQIRNKFSKFCLNNENCINIQKKKREWLKDKIDYIKGKNKSGDGKDIKQDIDIYWRKKLQLKEFYVFDTLTDKKGVSNNHGGRRKGSGVKLGTKRGKYKCKKNNKHIIENEIKEIEVKNIKTNFEF